MGHLSAFFSGQAAFFRQWCYAHAAARGARGLVYGAVNTLSIVRHTLAAFAILALNPAPAGAGAGADLIADAPTHYAELDELSVHYKLIGDSGSVTLLVHGGGCDLTFWELQVPALSGAGRVLLLDLPGHGESSAPEDIRYSMKLYGRAINAVMEAADVESAVVVGHSLGVPALREFYRGWPEKVDGFVAVDGILIYKEPGFTQRVMTWLLITPLYDYIWFPMVESFTGEKTPAWGVEKVNDAMKNAPKHIVRSFFPEMSHPDTAYNDGIDVPLLAIYAENPLWTEETQSRIRGFNDQAELVLLPDASHFLMLDDPDTTNRLLLDFAERIQPQ